MSLLERDLGHYCGLAMVGIKTANIMTCKYSDYMNLDSELNELASRLKKVGIIAKVLMRNADRIMVIVYREKRLQEKLSDSAYQQFLSQYGYGNFDNITSVLNHLELRLQEQNGFPHEIGVFLGYPLEDILGFIDNPKAYKLCGVWKVYEEVEQKQQIFNTYKKCTSAINRRMQLGHDLTRIFQKAL